jgi:hypothetical protein
MSESEQRRGFNRLKHPGWSAGLLPLVFNTSQRPHSAGIIFNRCHAPLYGKSDLKLADHAPRLLLSLPEAQNSHAF